MSDELFLVLVGHLIEGVLVVLRSAFAVSHGNGDLELSKLSQLVLVYVYGILPFNGSGQLIPVINLVLSPTTITSHGLALRFSAPMVVS
ncbi:hypothetical protein [Phytoactinopolyspora limicola]|uniref:hypothetical protein n=1 Tax=Phytoactinopolyspora limicola TaxID=2715536 RepID=UPI001407FE29|nr:hypothetical protein [Phytoactinopolyspora limicola]